MPLPSAAVGAVTDPVSHDVDPRWTMAFAAAVGDMDPRYLDTRLPGGVAAHPLFPVCLEWPAVTALRRLPALAPLTRDEAARGVHATHDLTLHRPVRPGERLTTTGTIAGVERRPPGAYQVVRLDTVDAEGGPVCTTWMGSLFLDVPVEGEDQPAAGQPPAPLSAPDGVEEEIRLDVPANAAHTYTECARIWNPIHTDAAVAERAGLPGIILHGTATLAMAISVAAPATSTVRRVACRFAAMVGVPSAIRVRVLAREAAHVWFEVVNEDGQPAVREGVIEC